MGLNFNQKSVIAGLNIINIECTKVEHISYTTGTCTLPDIYALAFGPVALGLMHIYQAKHLCPWYNYCINI